MRIKQPPRLILAGILVFAGGAALRADAPPAALDYMISWIGNTFSGGDAG